MKRTAKSKKKVMHLVRLLTKCSSSDAETAADSICQDPESVVLLGLACGLTTGMTVKGVTATKAAVALQAWPVAITSGAITGASAMAAKRFCKGVVTQGANAIDRAEKKKLQRAIGQ